MIACIFGWGKQHGTMRKTKQRGILRVGAGFILNLIAYNLIRIPKLLAAERGVRPTDDPPASQARRITKSQHTKRQADRTENGKNQQTSRFSADC
ncbi:MAG: hypothetical protein ACREDG_00665 [Methylocella sp.]